MTFTEIEEKVQVRLSNNSALVVDDIYNSIRFLNNFFGLRVWDSSLSTVADQNYVDISSLDVLAVDVVYVDGDEIKRLEDDEFDLIPKYESHNISRFYVVGDKIYFTVAPTAISTLKILIKIRFDDTVETTDPLDVPSELLELVELGAVSRHYLNMLSNSAVARENQPDINPEEIRNAKKDLDDHYNSLLLLLRSDSKYLL